MLRRKVLSLATALVSLLPGLAVAQDNTTPPPAPPPAAEPAVPAAAPAAGDQGKNEKTEEIVVTGSRVRRKDLTTPAPVTVINREQIQASGKTSIGEFLQAMPEQGGAINAQVNNGGDGSTQISLRTLGSNRTLVLVNGRRMVGAFESGSISVSVDLNSIPASAVERIEVLKDGASAVYGSDAIAGVVNIITRKSFNTTEFQAYTGVSARGDGTQYDLSATTGTSGDRGSILFSVGYFNQGKVLAGDRTFSEKIYALDYATGKLTFGGSSATPAGRFGLDPSDPGCTTAACAALRGQGITAAANLAVDPNAPGGARRYVSATDAYNFNPVNYLFTPQQRISLYSTGSAQLASFARGYFSASYVNRQSNQQLAPEPLFTVNNGISVSKDSMYNPYGVDLSDVRRRLVEFGPRAFSQDRDTIQLVGGFDGTLSESAGLFQGWFWDAGVNYGRVNGIVTTNGTLRVPLIAAAIGPSRRDATGTPRCLLNAAGSPDDPANVVTGCVPLNLLGGPGTITPDQVSGLGFFGTDRTTWQITSLQLNTSGELPLRLMAERPLGLALGYEHRREIGAFRPNPISQAGENSGNNSKATAGGFNVDEGYAELAIPFVTNLPAIANLEGSAAIRVFNYSTFGSDSTYKFGLRYSPISDFTLRGTYGTAFRSPSILELYQGTSDNFPTVSDPCSGGPVGSANHIDPNSALGQRCGAAANNLDDRSQQKSHNGGNTELKPETAKIWTAGAVFAPSFLKNLSVTLDYYNIAIDKSIGTLGTGVILQNCYGAATSKFCDLVHRTPGGLIDFVDDLNTNVGGESVSGIDGSVRYGLPSPFGRFTFAWDGTYMIKHNVTLADGTVIKSIGTYDLLNTAGPMPKYKFNAGVVWGLGGLGAGVNTRYVGGYTECANADGVSGSDGLCYLDSSLTHHVNYWNAWDAFVTYTLPSRAGRTNFAVGVVNAFDTRPPHAYNNGTYPSDPSAYDFMGRFFYVRLAHAL